MRLTGLLLSSVVLIALGVGLYVSNRQKSAEAAKPPADASPKVLSLTEPDIKKIDIKKRGSEETVLDRTNAGWQITAPKPYLVDKDTASQLATAVASVSSDKVVEDKGADLKEYGLTSPSLEVDVSMKDGKTKKLLIGDDTPTGSDAYAM